MIDCRTTKAKLGRLVDGELPPTEQAAIESHIQGCSTCRDELGALQALSTRLDGLIVPPVPETLASNVMSRVLEQGAESRPGLGVFGFWMEWSAAMRIAACATAIVACLAGTALSSGVTRHPPRDTEMSWVGLASGAPIAYAYGEPPR